jgi:hypothetical protein
MNVYLNLFILLKLNETLQTNLKECYIKHMEKRKTNLDLKLYS